MSTDEALTIQDAIDDDAPQDAPPEDIAPDRSAGRRRRAGRRATTAPETPTPPAAPKRAPRARKTASGKPDLKHIADTVVALHTLTGAMALPAAGLPGTGEALIAAGPDAGKVWAALAERYPIVAKVFSTGGDGMLMVQLIMVYWPIVSLAMAERSAAAQRAQAAKDADAGGRLTFTPFPAEGFAGVG